MSEAAPLVIIKSVNVVFPQWGDVVVTLYVGPAKESVSAMADVTPEVVADMADLMGCSDGAVVSLVRAGGAALLSRRLFPRCGERAVTNDGRDPARLGSREMLARTAKASAISCRANNRSRRSIEPSRSDVRSRPP